MLREASVEHQRISARKVKQFPMELAMDNLPAVMEKLGFGFATPRAAREMREMTMAYVVDSIQQGITTPSIPGLIQFLQFWMPGQVHVMTAAREIDNFIGLDTMGSWEDEEVVQEVIENVGYAKPYGDYTNVPLADWNLNFVPRTIVRLELGMRVGVLEEKRAARVRTNSPEMKRQSCGINLEIARNLIGFNGYNNGANNTYGFLNDPGLLPYQNVANGAASSPLWSKKVFREIQLDLLTALVQLRTQSKGNINPNKTPITLAIALNAVDYLSTTTDFGISVMDWLNKTYPNIRVESAIQLDTANGGVGVFYMFAENVVDLSTDGGKVWVQPVPAKFMVLGVQKLAKAFEEDYSNATAGAMCKRPFAVQRWSGIS